MRWLPTPTQLDDAGKVMGGAGVICGTVLGCWKPIRKRYRAWQAKREDAKAAAAKLIADRLIEDQREAARRVAEELRTQLIEQYELGQRHMLESITSIKELMGDHTLSDEQQFTELRARSAELCEQQVRLKNGQEETHETLAEMMNVLRERGQKMEAIQLHVSEISGYLKGLADQERRHP